MEVVQEVTQDGQIYLANSMNSLRIEGEAISVEVIKQFDWEVPDFVIVPGETSAISMRSQKGCS